MNMIQFQSRAVKHVSVRVDLEPYLPVNSDFLLFMTGVREAGHPSSKLRRGVLQLPSTKMHPSLALRVHVSLGQPQPMHPSNKGCK